MAKGITESTVEEIKARIDLADLIASYGIQVKTAGASKKACCPFHHEKTPSFNINESKGFYHCFGCGESGDAIKFVQKMDGLTFVEAVKKLAEQCGVKIEEKEDPAAGKRKRLHALMAELAQFYHRCLLKMKEAEPAREYLKSRDLGDEVQESFLIGYAPNGAASMLKWAEKYGYTAAEMEEAGVIKPPRGPGDQGYHRFGGRLMFSIKDKQGRVVAFSGRQLVASKNSGKYVNSPETLIFKKSNVLFGFDKAAGNIAKSPHHEAIVCEGQIDTIRLHISGFPVAVASQGTAFTEEHVKMLKKVSDQVTLVFDDDAAGHKATIRTAGLFLAAEMPVRVVSLPEGDDPDSYLRKHPAADFQKLLDNAESIMSFQVRAERQKEAKPDSIDAMARITKAVLNTIAQSKNAVIKAGMVGEASRLLGVPSAALNEELGKIKIQSSNHRITESKSGEAASSPLEEEEDFVDFETSGEDAASPLPGEDAAVVIPPSMLEIELCAFLLCDVNRYDVKLSGLVGEWLPSVVIGHEFTRRFVDAWRTGVCRGDDSLEQWGKGLVRHELKWYDAVISNTMNFMVGAVSSSEFFVEHYLRNMWKSKLEREEGAMPANPVSQEDIIRGVRLRQDKQRIKDADWPELVDIMSYWIPRF